MNFFLESLKVILFIWFKNNKTENFGTIQESVCCKKNSPAEAGEF